MKTAHHYPRQPKSRFITSFPGTTGYLCPERLQDRVRRLIPPNHNKEHTRSTAFESTREPRNEKLPQNPYKKARNVSPVFRDEPKPIPISATR
jgi:hypothetical protein